MKFLNTHEQAYKQPKLPQVLLKSKKDSKRKEKREKRKENIGFLIMNSLSNKYNTIRI